MGWLGFKALVDNEVESALKDHDTGCHPYGKEIVLTTSLKSIYHGFLYFRSFSSHSCRDLSVSQAERGGQVMIEARVD